MENQKEFDYFVSEWEYLLLTGKDDK